MKVTPGRPVAAATLSPRSADLISDTLIGRRGGGTRPDDLEWPRRAIVGAIVAGRATLWWAAPIEQVPLSKGSSCEPS